MKGLLCSVSSISTILLMLIAIGLAQNKNYSRVEATISSDDIVETATSNNASSLGLEFSSDPIWEEEATSTGMTPINDTHRIVTFVGNDTIVVPDTRENVNMTNNGTAIISPVKGSPETFSAYGRESV